ncbi:hypothetical protein [Rasiella rasia]|nr:hypothetical protein [Rasiella rasia]
MKLQVFSITQFIANIFLNGQHFDAVEFKEMTDGTKQQFKLIKE